MEGSALLKIQAQDGTELEPVNFTAEKLSDKAFIMEMISIIPFALKIAHESLRGDKDVIRAAAKKDINALQFVPDELRADKAFIMEMISINPFALKYAHESLRGDKDVIRAAAKKNINALQFTPDELLADKAFIMEIISINPFALKYAHESLRGDKDVVRAVARGGAADTQIIGALRFAAENLLIDKTFITEMISINPFALKYAHESLRGDKDVICAAAKKDINALQCAPDELLADKAFIMEMVSINPFALKYAHESLRGDKDVVRAVAREAADTQSFVLKYAHESLRGDKDVVRAVAREAADTQSIGALRFAAENLLIDKTFITEMISIEPLIIRWAHESLRGDKDVVHAAATKDSDALEFATENFLIDKTFIMEMISIDPWALKYAHESLRGDKDVIRAAANGDIEAVELATDNLLIDKTFIMEMISINPFALAYAHESLKGDKDVIRAAANGDIEALELATDNLLIDEAFIIEMISINPFALKYAHESLQANKKLRLTAVMHDARAITYLIPILKKETDCKEEGRTLLATALASPGPEKPLLRPGREYKRLLTVALSLAIQSNIPCRLSRFLKRYGHGAAYLYHNTLGVAEKDSSESTPWTGYHAAILHAIDTGRLKLVKETLLDQVPSWPKKKVASNDPFFFALWNAVQSIDHTKHPDLYFTLYMHIMDCLSTDTEDVLHVESALTAIANIIENLKAHVRYVLSDELLKTLETIYDDANMYQRHLTISTDKQGEQAATIVPLRYKPINDLLEKVIGLYELFNGRYKRIARKEHIGTDTPLAAHDLQCAETELRSLQRAIRGKDHRIFNAICFLINPYRDHLSSQSVFANGTSSAIPSPDATISESTQGEAKRQKTS